VSHKQCNANLEVNALQGLIVRDWEHCKASFAKYCQFVVSIMGPNKLLDVYAAPQNFVIRTGTLPEGIPLLFETNHFKGSPGHTTGNLSIVRPTVFKGNFEKFTHGFFKQVSDSNRNSATS
jgi:hypothetical protein